MPTRHTRLNLTLDEAAFHSLSLLSKLQRKQIGTVAKELLYNKIEEVEDHYLLTLRCAGRSCTNLAGGSPVVEAKASGAA